MALMKRVSGIRGTIGGVQGENLTPADIVSFVAAYATWLKSETPRPLVVIGRDGRISGAHVVSLVSETLRAMGVDVIDAGLSTTPTVELYVPHSGAQGGIIVTASHNPREWNALKFLNASGEFISPEAGEQILAIAAHGNIEYASIDDFGTVKKVTDAIDHHIALITRLDRVDVEAVRKKKFHVVADCINSTGALAIPVLLEAMGCTFQLLHDEINGEFAHNPEPLAENLTELCRAVKQSNAVLGIAVDPDVDRLAFVDEQGIYFGEEFTLVAVADYILQYEKGPCVSNLSSSLALRDIAAKHGQSWSAAKVGEVHVVGEMKRTDAVIGGEGNGGVIYPRLHYGRDALVGIALMLTALAKGKHSMSELKRSYPEYYMAKSKMDLQPDTPADQLIEGLAASYPGAEIDRRDGVKILRGDEWIHLRASNTEPVIRIYGESRTQEDADRLVRDAVRQLKDLAIA